MADFDWENNNGEQWLARAGDWEAMLKPFDSPIIDWIAENAIKEKQGAPLRVADIACGGGGTTFSIEPALPKKSILHGYDISHAMVDATQRKALAKGSRAEFFQVDLQTTYPPKEPYDLIVSRFGTMFFTAPEDAFNNIQKWLAPDGKFLFAIWGSLKKNPWSKLVLEVAERFVELPSTGKDAPGPFRYANLELVMPLLENAGFQNIKVDDWHCKLAFGGGMNAEDAANFAVNDFAASDELRKAGESVFNQAQQAIAEELRQYEIDNKVVMDAFVHFVSGTKHA